MSTPRKAGWFAEIPKELKDEFSRLYPGRSNIRRFTEAFVRWAIRNKPRDITSINPEEPNGKE